MPRGHEHISFVFSSASREKKTCKLHVEAKGFKLQVT